MDQKLLVQALFKFICGLLMAKAVIDKQKEHA